jgi:hypothetical protein
MLARTWLTVTGKTARTSGCQARRFHGGFHSIAVVFTGNHHSYPALLARFKMPQPLIIECLQQINEVGVLAFCFDGVAGVDSQ